MSVGNSFWTCRRKMAELLLGTVFSLSSFNCIKTPAPPVAPSWDVDLTFPVGIKTVTVGDLVDKDPSALKADPAHRIVYSKIMAVPSTLVGDRISLMPANAYGQIRLGTFNVEVKPVITEINVPSIPRGITIPVPSQTMNLPTIATAMSSTTTVEVSSGSVGLTLKNNLPVDIAALNPVQLIDDHGNVEAIFDFTGSAIPAGGSRTVYDNLAGKSLGDGVSIAGLNFSTPGSSSPVRIPPDSMLVATMIMDNIRASAAQITGIPAQRLIDNDRTAIRLNDSTQVSNVAIRSGSLRFAFTNRIAVGVQFKFRLEELLRPAAGGYAPYEDSLFLPALGGNSYTLNLSGCRLRAPAGQLLSALQLTSSVVIPTDVSGRVAVHDTDKVQIDMSTLAPIVADSVTGVIKPTWIDVHSAVALNLGSFSSKLVAQLNIPSASLTLNTVSSVGFPADLDLRVSAVKSTGEVVYLDIPAGQRRVQAGGGAIAFDGAEVGAFLSKLSGRLPDSLQVSGKVLVNPPDCYSRGAAGAGSVGRNSSFSGSVTLSIPMNLGISQATYRDTTGFGVTEDGGGKKPGQSELANVNGAKLFVEVQNGLPAQVGVRVYLLDAMHRRLLTLPQSGQSLQVNAAAVDAQGIAAMPGTSTLTINLSHAEAQLYIPAEYVEYELDLATASGGSPAVFLTSDAVRVRVWTQCSYGVNN
jgi:hypothetical protein